MPFNWKLLTCTVWDMHCSQYWPIWDGSNLWSMLHKCTRVW
jgi:hypothetical protein